MADSTQSPPISPLTAPARLPSPALVSASEPANSTGSGSSIEPSNSTSTTGPTAADPTEPPSMTSSTEITKSPPPLHSASPVSTDPFPNDFELYALPPAKSTRFTENQVKRLNHLVFTLGCVEGRKNNEWAIEEVWMVIPESRGGGADIHLTMAQVVQFIRVWAKQVPDKHLRMAKFYKWIEQQPESKKPWLSERDLAVYCKLTYPHMHAKEREFLEQRKISSKPDAKKDADTGSQDSAASSIEGSIRVDVSARAVPPAAADNALNPTGASSSVYLPEAAIPLPNTPTTRSRTTASSVRQSPVLARHSLPPPGAAPQVAPTGTPTRSRTVGDIAAVLATVGPSQYSHLSPSVCTPETVRFGATGPIAAEALVSGPFTPPSRFRAVRGVPAETPASGLAPIPSSPPPTEYPPVPTYSLTMASAQEPPATIAPFQQTLSTSTIRPQADTPAATSSAEQVFHLTIRAITDPIQHLAVTPGLVSLFVGGKNGDTVTYTISVMGFQVVEHLMRTPGFTGVKVGPCGGCWTCRQAVMQSD